MGTRHAWLSSNIREYCFLRVSCKESQSATSAGERDIILTPGLCSRAGLRSGTNDDQSHLCHGFISPPPPVWITLTCLVLQPFGLLFCLFSRRTASRVFLPLFCSLVFMWCRQFEGFCEILQPTAGLARQFLLLCCLARPLSVTN